MSANNSVMIARATKNDLQDCLALLAANRGFYNPLIEALNREKGSSLPLLHATQFTDPAVQKTMLPVHRPDTELWLARQGSNGPVIGIIMGLSEN